LAGEAPAFDFSRIMARKNAVIGDFAAFRQGQLTEGRFELIRASARFLDPHRLQLSNGKEITAGSFVIATGSRVSPAPLPQLHEVGYLTSDDALTLTAPPGSLLVLGAGATAMEFAQFFSRFDTKVTIIQRSPHVLKDFDADAGGILEEALRAEGLTVHTGTRLLDARHEGGEKVVRFEKEGEIVESRAEEIFFGLGRSPDIDKLGLDAAGVQTEDGRIVTQPTQQTSAPHIYAAGDCCGPYEIVHIAIQQGEIAARNIARASGPVEMDYRLLISVVFTDPQVASVGLNEKQAEANNVRYLAATYPFNDHGKSIIMNAMHGHAKLLADPGSGEILGGTCVGPSAGELIHEVVAAMHKRMTVHELASMPHYHPTLAEIWTYPAEELADQIPV
jgi:pyruvate/2-oxoglutarate dehydrogenase complex dihydrolipoamide dehydrogenase (E3) component